MLPILAVAALVLGITYYQSIQGLFSSLIMAVLTVLCAAVAVNFYEPVASILLYTRQPAYADAIALTALFVLPLLGLRLAADRLIAGNVVLPRWLDRFGGSLAGLITGILHMGILMLVVQMLPFGPSVMGYQPFDEMLRRKDRLVPFYPDEFTIGLGKMLSAGAFSGRRSFARAHDDLLLELYCARNRPNRIRRLKGRKMLQSRLGRFDAMPGHLRVEAAYECEPQHVEQWCQEDVHPLLRHEPLPYEKNNAQKGELRKIIVVRTLVDKGAREGAGSHAAVNWWVLPATQFRLVGEGGRSFYPVGYLTHLDDEKAIKEARRDSMRRRATTTPSDKPVEVEWRGTRLKLWVKPQQWKFIAAAHDRTKTQWFLTELIVEREWVGGKDDLVVDWVYRIPVNEVPAYMVFRRVAKAAVPKPVTAQEAGKVLFSKEFSDQALDRRV
ncbi:MAG: CvpA family protein [Phycisphaerae bacterium]|nr:CvpA family protein [Phycisphaerae bacterium]